MSNSEIPELIIDDDITDEKEIAKKEYEVAEACQKVQKRLDEVQL